MGDIRDQAPVPPMDRVPDHMVDRFFDRELTRAESAKLFDSLRADPEAARDLVQTQRALDALRRPVQTPDLSRAILAKVNGRTPLLTRRGVRHIRVGRLVSAAALVAVIAGAFVIQRQHPQIVHIGGTDLAPIAEIAMCMPADTSDAVHTIRQTAKAIRVTATAEVLPSRQDGRMFAGKALHTAAVPGRPLSTEAVFVRARLVPDSLFPWRQQSPPPSTGSEPERVAWVVPCGAMSPGSCDGIGDRFAGGQAGLILLDVHTELRPAVGTESERSILEKK